MKLLELFEKEGVSLSETLCQKGEVIAYEGDYCPFLFLVKKGKVEVSSNSLSGNKITYNILNSSDIFGNNLLFSSSPYFKGNVIALEQSLIIRVKKEDLVEALMKKEEILKEYLRIQSDSMKNLNARIRLLSLDSAKERLLLYLQENGGAIEFSSISSLSSILGVQRETLSRLVSAMEKKKEIKRRAHHLEKIR